METTTMNIPVLALRGLTAFPNLTLSLEAEREISIFALDSAMQSERKVFLVTQREIGTADPEEEDLYEVGTVCRDPADRQNFRYKRPPDCRGHSARAPESPVADEAVPTGER